MTSEVVCCCYLGVTLPWYATAASKQVIVYLFCPVMLHITITDNNNTQCELHTHTHAAPVLYFEGLLPHRICGRPRSPAASPRPPAAPRARRTTRGVHPPALPPAAGL